MLLEKHSCWLEVDADGLLCYVGWGTKFPAKYEISGLRIGMQFSDVCKVYPDLIRLEEPEEDALDISEYWTMLENGFKLELRIRNDQLTGMDLSLPQAEKAEIDLSRLYPPPLPGPCPFFADPGLKFVVLEALLGLELIDLGEPEDLATFVLDRPVDFVFGPSPDGYDLIRNVTIIWPVTPLTQELLNQVKTLCFDGGHDIYTYMFRYWDGEIAEFDIQSLEGLEHLPNLEELHIISMFDVDAQQPALNQLAARGVRIKT